ncbi:MAG: glycosyltransferase, partial [Pseudomonadota bacterium]
MIGIIVPAHNEEEKIAACLQSLVIAASRPALDGEEVALIVVLDACTDRTGPLARSLGATTIDVHARNVGLARHEGARFSIAAGARWLAFTDADSVVAPDW